MLFSTVPQKQISILQQKHALFFKSFFFFYIFVSLSRYFFFLKYKIKREIARNVSKQTKIQPTYVRMNETKKKNKISKYQAIARNSSNSVASLCPFDLPWNFVHGELWQWMDTYSQYVAWVFFKNFPKHTHTTCLCISTRAFIAIAYIAKCDERHREEQKKTATTTTK